MNIFYYETTLGKIGITEHLEEITGVFFLGDDDKENTPHVSPTHKVFESKVIKEGAKQIKEYLSGKRKEFVLPLKMQGTEFEQSVYKQLLQIPYGQTRSYEDIAKQVGKEKACRAVGNANNKNPIAIIVPCHRVIGKNGSLTGYAGGLNIKERLLNLEQKSK